jgi:hypothetical protein
VIGTDRDNDGKYFCFLTAGNASGEARRNTTAGAALQRNTADIFSTDFTAKQKRV